MHISGLTGSQVWLSSSRSLTNFGASALTAVQTVQTTLAVNAQVDLRTAAGVFGHIAFAIATGVGATASCNSSLWDGTNAILIVATAAAASSAAYSTAINCNSVGVRLFNNDLTHAGFYIASQLTYTQ